MNDPRNKSLIEQKRKVTLLMQWLHSFDDLKITCTHRNVIEKIWELGLTHDTDKIKQRT